MNRYLKMTVLAATLAAVVGCDDFLTGEGLTIDPNFPTESPTVEQLAVSSQVRLFINQEGQVARTAAIWTQQLAGINNQQRDYGSRYDYSRNELDTNTAFNNVYFGLRDLRLMRETAVAGGNAFFEAMAMFMEAFTMGTAASLWGDIPYRQAINPDIPSPAIDPQEQVYADVQALLSEAIARFGAAGAGARPADLIYGGNTERWIAAAHTLKARYHLHVAPRVGQTAYQAALTNANQGINEVPTAAQVLHGQGPGDFRSLHGTTLNIDANTWGNFLAERADIAANRRMTQILAQRNDPRQGAYHAPTAGGEFRGSDQFGVGGDAQPWSLPGATRTALGFRQPFITWAETQLIKAEANFMLDSPGPALADLNSVRTLVGLDALPGPVTLEEIMVEKWIVQFQNVDVYSDWRRHCFPRLVPGGPNAPDPAARVPGRYVYGSAERQQNSSFVGLAPAQQPADNWNFSQEGACPSGNVGGEQYPAPAP
jgi:starch-binding outer membrane protein, SusD/RagB family